MPSNENFSGVTAETSKSPVRVLIAGGSYAGLSATLNLLDLCNGRKARMCFEEEAPDANKDRIDVQITLVDERDGYYHLIGSPLSLASKDYYEKAWTNFDDIAALKGAPVRFIRGSLREIDPSTKVATIAEHETRIESQESYDYFVAGSGLRRVWPTVPQSLNKKGYLEETATFREAVEKAREGVVVIGGGAVGVEIASELKVFFPNQNITLIHSRDQLLSSEALPDEFKQQTLKDLRESGVQVILGDRVMETKPVETEDKSPLFRLTLKDGSHMLAGHVVSAISHMVPTTTYLPDAAIDKNKYVKIKSTLQFNSTVPNAESHFAAGDLVAWSGIKRCGAAMHQGHYAARNIHQLILQSQKKIEKPAFKELGEVPPMMALAVGKKAVCYSPDAGVRSGEDQMEIMFGKDLGWTICWNHMKLGKDYEP